MIFSEAHIEQIKAGTKTQTRRSSDRYQVGKLYAIQPCRNCKGIKEGKIFIKAKSKETKFRQWDNVFPQYFHVLPSDAKAEGGYLPLEYEKLYEKMHPGWTERWTYLFMYYPIRAIEMMERGEFPDFMLESTNSQQVGKETDQ